MTCADCGHTRFEHHGRGGCCVHIEEPDLDDPDGGVEVGLCRCPGFVSSAITT